MQRVYTSRILPKPVTINWQGKKVTARAVQVPIEYQQLTRNQHLLTWSIDPRQELPLDQYLPTLRLTYYSGTSKTLREEPSGKAKKQVTLHLKAVEEQGEGSEIFTLVYDHENLIPICNFRNKALNSTEVQALEIDPAVTAEAAAEVRTALLTTGSGHYSRLVGIHNQEGFKFIVDKLSAFQPFLSMIKDKALRAFVRKVIILSFAQFYLGPSSTGARHHPLDEITIRGLLFHSLRVAFLAMKLVEKLKLPAKQKQEVLAAALLHDICKGVIKKDDGSFVWGFHSTADHSVIGVEWLRSVLNQHFPNMNAENRSSVERSLQSVYYHSNIWVDNYDTALTENNPIADWLVSLADFAVSHKHVRANIANAGEERSAQAVNEILANPLEFEWEKMVDNWAQLPAKTQKALLIASLCFKQYEIAEAADQQEVIQAIVKGECPAADPQALTKDKKKLAVWAALSVAETPGIDIYLREDINQVLSQAKIRESHWIEKEHVPEETQAISGQLLNFLQTNFRDDFWLKLKDQFLNLVNSRVKSDLVTAAELSDELLAALMLKYGTIDMEKIYQEVCGNWSGKAKIRAILKESAQLNPEDAIRRMEAAALASGYSSTAVGKAEEALREKLNSALGTEAAELKAFLPEIDSMLDRDLPAREAAMVKKLISGADRVKYPRFSTRKVLARINAAIPINLPDHVKKALTHELDYVQRLPFNRMNDEIVAWLMECYGASADTILAMLEQAGLDKVVPILQKYEAETRQLDAKYIAGLGRTRQNKDEKEERARLAARAISELKPLLPAPVERKSIFAGTIPELVPIAHYMQNYGLNMNNLEEFLKYARDPGNYKYFDYLPDINRGADLVLGSIGRLSENEKIAVYGDYDADGICGTVTLIKALREVAKHNGKDASHVQHIGYHIPPRQRGFGMNQQSLTELIDAGYTTIITTDNGVGAKAEVEFARSYAATKGKKLTIIITDHHTITGELPAADAVIHPKRLAEDHPARDDSGTFTAWKFASALYKRAGLEIGDKSIEYAAIATVTDIVPMPQKSENRAVTYFGFEKFNRLYARLSALEDAQKEAEGFDRIAQEKLYNSDEFKESGLDLGLYLLAKLIKINSFDRGKIGFGLGPVLNAIGRMSEAHYAVDLLLAETPEEALALAEKLIAANVRRKELQSRIEEEALAQLETLVVGSRAVVLSSDQWHKGVVGLVAATIAGHINGLAAVGSFRSGSMRSIPGLHIMQVLRRAVELYREDGNEDSFFEKFGGHAGAAGYTIKEDKLEVFRIYLAKATQDILEKDPGFKALYGEGNPKKPVNVESLVEVENLSASFYLLGNLFAPFAQQTYGRTNEVPQPVFATRRVKVVDFGTLGGEQNHLRIEFEDKNGRRMEGMYFRENNLSAKSMLHAKSADQEVYVDIAYTVEVDYKGRVQMIITDMQPADHSGHFLL